MPLSFFIFGHGLKKQSNGLWPKQKIEMGILILKVMACGPNENRNGPNKVMACLRERKGARPSLPHLADARWTPPVQSGYAKNGHARKREPLKWRFAYTWSIRSQHEMSYGSLAPRPGKGTTLFSLRPSSSK